MSCIVAARMKSGEIQKFIIEGQSNPVEVREIAVAELGKDALMVMARLMTKAEQLAHDLASSAREALESAKVAAA